jgi:hypothetical protein
MKKTMYLLKINESICIVNKINKTKVKNTKEENVDNVGRYSRRMISAFSDSAMMAC